MNQNNPNQDPNTDPVSGVNAQNVQPQSGNSIPEQPPPPPSVWNLAKTVLDYEACKSVVSQLLVRTKTKIDEHVPEASEFKEPIPNERIKICSPCSSSWEGMTGTEDIRFCKQCLCAVYNLRYKDIAEVDELMFQREGLRNATFYQRKDGKYLTRDCPVGKRTKLVFISSMIVAGSALIAAVYGISQLPAPTFVVMPSVPNTGKQTTSKEPSPVRAHHFRHAHDSAAPQAQ